MGKFGLVGKSLKHSFSANYFAQKFEREGWNHDYRNFELGDISKFSGFINLNPELIGLNVTIPYKTEIIPFLDNVDAVAADIGAVNTIHIQNGSTTGYNTDFIGFRNSIKPFLKHGMEKALILGTGGASKAITYVFSQLGINSFFVSRTERSANTFTYDMLNDEAIRQFKLIVNTTPLGTFPNIETFPEIPYEAITKEHLLYDLTYNPEESQFLLRGRKQGANTVNGLSMLKIQADESWKIWNS